MSILSIVILVAAICGLVYFFPRLPRMGQIIVAVLVVVACLLVILNFAGVPVHL